MPPPALQGNLVAPTTAAALAAQGALASNAKGQVALPSNPGVSLDASLAVGAAAPATAGFDGSLGDHGAGDFGAGGRSLLPGAGLGETGVSGLDAASRNPFARAIAA